MRKTELLSWRISPDLKSALEDAARSERISVSRLLDGIVTEWVERTRAGADDEALQRRLHRDAARTLGKVRGGDPDRAERARERVRARLTKRRAR